MDANVVDLWRSPWLVLATYDMNISDLWQLAAYAMDISSFVTEVPPSQLDDCSAGSFPTCQSLHHHPLPRPPSLSCSGRKWRAHVPLDLIEWVVCRGRLQPYHKFAQDTPLRLFVVINHIALYMSPCRLTYM
ncbi:hypothetical protein GOP47_0030452 [Adiantum capillus-veneris]|nr:hypothetical protein GOP47_0030452 [Adiantum capillus-veneris]